MTAEKRRETNAEDPADGCCLPIFSSRLMVVDEARQLGTLKIL